MFHCHWGGRVHSQSQTRDGKLLRTVGARVSKQGDTNLSQSPVLNISHIDRLPLFPLTDAQDIKKKSWRLNVMLYRHCHQGEYLETLGQNAWMTTDFTGTIKGAHAAMGSAYTQTLAWIWRASRPHPKLTFNLRVKALTFIFAAIWAHHAASQTLSCHPPSNPEMLPSIKPWDVTLRQTLRCYPPSNPDISPSVKPWEVTLHQTLRFHPPSNPEMSPSIKPWDDTLHQTLWFHPPSNPEMSPSIKPWDVTLHQTLWFHPHQTLRCHPPSNPEMSPSITTLRFHPLSSPEMSPSVKPWDVTLHHWNPEMSPSTTETLRCHPPPNTEMLPSIEISSSTKPWDSDSDSLFTKFYNKESVSKAVSIQT